LQAYAAAGADVLFAPGPEKPPEIKTLVEAVAPKPLNLFVVRDTGFDVGAIAELGVRRISVGGALALAAWTGFVHAAQQLRSKGSFAGFASLVPYADLNGLFASRSNGQQAQRGNGPRIESSIEPELPTRGPVDDQWGRSCSLDPGNEGDIADEGLGHRG
jgi:hypothetical protein